MLFLEFWNVKTPLRGWFFKTTTPIHLALASRHHRYHIEIPYWPLENEKSGRHLEPVVFLVSLRGSRWDARALWSITR